MKAIILAAGMGTRLRPETYKVPKCLVNVAGKPILYYQLKAFELAKAEKVIIVTGYLMPKVREFIKNIDLGIPIELVENKQYDRTNNMFSLKLALDKLKEKNELNDTFFICNGDVIFEKDLIIDAVTNSRGNTIFIDRSQYLSESMKVTINQSEEISDISKSISQSDYSGVSIDLYRFDSEGIKKLKEVVDYFINRGEKNLWTEVAIQKLVQDKILTIYPKDITGYIWWEIDTFSDVKRAEWRLKLINNIDLILNKKVYAFDLDGTLIRGNRPIRGATDFLNLSKSLGKTISFITNNSSMSNERHKKRLEDTLHIQIEEKMIYSSLDHLKEFLKEKNISRIFPILNNEAIKYLGDSYTIDEENPEAVIVGFDTELTYKKIEKACLLIEEGIPFIVVNPDIRCPVNNGFIPDSGSIGKLIEAVTNKNPYYVGGKPNPAMIKKMAERYLCNIDEVCYFGDRAYTDIEMAKQAHTTSILMLTGETNFEELVSVKESEELLADNSVFIGENYIFLRGVFEKHLSREKGGKANVL